MAPTPPKRDRPIFWIIAGPNGSGKSTSYHRTDIEGWDGAVWIVNPDLLTATLVEQEGYSSANANVEALNRIEAWLGSSLRVHQTVGVETVLSSSKYRKWVKRARSLGYEVRLIYVLLESAELQLKRISARVRSGGHDVPSEKVIARRLRSFRQLAWFCRNTDRAVIFDNSGSEPRRVASASFGQTLRILEPLPNDLHSILTRLRLPLTSI